MIVLGAGKVEAENLPVDQWDNLETLVTMKWTNQY